MWTKMNRIHTHKVVAGSKEASCPVGLGCIQEMVSDGHKGYFPAVKVLVQDLQKRGKMIMHVQ